MQQRYRLRRAQDFARLRREGRVFHHHWMRLSLTPNGLTFNRYGFITSKQLGNAVTRNRVRRLMREAIRHLQPRLRPGFDIVLIARRPVIGQPFDAVQRIVEDLIHRADILVEGSPE
jgi:ribonuclease P protein component